MQTFLNDLLKSQERISRATVRFEYADDPKIPGRRTYKITGPSRESVQQAIESRMKWVDVANGGVPGFAQFTNPGKLDDGRWATLGEVIIDPVDA